MNDLNNNPQQIAANNQTAATRTSFEDPADAGILNQNLRITYARDNATDITQQFQLYTFRFAGNYPGGEAQVWNDLFARIGSWNGGDGTFTIALPTDPFWEMAFLNRTWMITETGPGMFTLTADGDEVRLVIKKE